MKFEIRGAARFSFELTRSQIELLRYYSQSHYDWTCRSASGVHVNAFITGWYNHAVMTESDSIGCCASFRELDTCCKILESAALEHDQQRRVQGFQLKRDFADALRYYSTVLNSRWVEEFETRE